MSDPTRSRTNAVVASGLSAHILDGRDRTRDFYTLRERLVEIVGIPASELSAKQRATIVIEAIRALKGHRDTQPASPESPPQSLLWQIISADKNDSAVDKLFTANGWLRLFSVLALRPDAESDQEALLIALRLMIASLVHQQEMLDRYSPLLDKALKTRRNRRAWLKEHKPKRKTKTKKIRSAATALLEQGRAPRNISGIIAKQLKVTRPTVLTALRGHRSGHWKQKEKMR